MSEVCSIANLQKVKELSLSITDDNVVRELTIANRQHIRVMWATKVL